jgi:rod shape-determining protein MreC
MENFFSRYKNPLVLMAVLFIQIVALATQIKRPDGARGPGSGSTRLIRVWTVTVITPFEQVLVGTGHFFRNTWHNYIDLRDVRKQNRELQEELARMRMEQAHLQSVADESRRLRALLEFKDRYVGQTLAAEVIGTSGTDSLRTITIDKGSHAGVKPGMAVITPDGIVGKVKEVFTFSSQVLMINDRESGAGVVLQNSRLRGILRGVGQGDLQVSDIMSDEKVDLGEQVLTSGGDGVYPKGLPVGTVTHVSNDTESGPFLAVKIKSAASLDRLEEVLVVTRIAEEAPPVAGDATPVRASEILAQRLPGVSKTADNSANGASSPAPVLPVTAKPGLQPDQSKPGPTVQTPGPQAPGTGPTKASPAADGSAQPGAAGPHRPPANTNQTAGSSSQSQARKAVPSGNQANATPTDGAKDKSAQPRAAVPHGPAARAKASPKPPATETGTPEPQAVPTVSPETDKDKTPPAVEPEKPPR